jgi:hypothetical protein
MENAHAPPLPARCRAVATPAPHTAAAGHGGGGHVVTSSRRQQPLGDATLRLRNAGAAGEDVASRCAPHCAHCERDGAHAAPAPGCVRALAPVQDAAHA